jgi:hypothetical protein
MKMYNRSGYLSRIIGCVAATSLLLALTPAAVQADVTVERFIKSGGFGGVGASEGASTDKISGLKKRSESSVKMTGKIGGFLSKFAGNMGSDDIVLINEDRVISIKHKDKTYTQRSISFPEEEEYPGSERGPGNGASAGDEHGEKRNIKVVRNEITVRKTGEKKPINGFDCTQYIVTWILETEDLDTGDRATSTMTSDQWNTPATKETKTLQKEEGAFNEAYLKKMALDIPPQKMKSFGLMVIAGMLGADREEMERKMKELEKKFSTIEGYPISSAVTWETTSTAEQKQQPEGEPEAIDLSKGVGGLLSGLTRKAMKKEPSGEEKKAGEGSVIFSSYTEIRKIDTSSVPGSNFEVPAGYARK